ncbi:MAG: hypothetical protein AAGF26_06720, partial [Cyanobacteria bacterium P01_G01_bin.49]
QQFIAVSNLFIDLLLILYVILLLFLGLLAILSFSSTVISGLFLLFISILPVLLIIPTVEKLLNAAKKELLINKILLLRLLSRILGLAVVCYCLLIIPLKIADNIVLSNNLVTQLLITIEYQQNSICKNIDPNQKVAYLKANLVSVATYSVENNQYQFTVKSCLIKL